MCKTRKVKVRNCDMIALQTRPYDPAVLRKEAAMRQLRQDGRRMCLRRGTGEATIARTTTVATA